MDASCSDLSDATSPSFLGRGGHKGIGHKEVSGTGREAEACLPTADSKKIKGMNIFEDFGQIVLRKACINFHCYQ